MARIAPGFAMASSSTEDALLEAQILEHRLDHEIGVLHVGDVERAADAREALVHRAAVPSLPRETLLS